MLDVKGEGGLSAGPDLANLTPLPDQAQTALAEAAACWDDGVRAEAAILRALAAAPEHLATRIGAYKYYFYKHRLREAAPLALWCVEWAAHHLGIPKPWRDVSPNSQRFGGLESLPRFYLFALKAYGYVLVRSGSTAEGRAALAKVVDLDPLDHIGAARVLAVVDGGPVTGDEPD